jgi:hypothetical protein
MASNMDGIIDLLMPIVNNLRHGKAFWIAASDGQALIDIPSTGDSGLDFSFKSGRAYALAHPTTYEKAMVFQVVIGKILGDESPGQLLVSRYDVNTSQMDAIPFDIVRDETGTITRLVDTGRVIQVSAFFLPAFHIGMRTSRFKEKDARRYLQQEMEKQASMFINEAERRMGKDFPS